MLVKANYTEPCICGCNLDTIIEERAWRIVAWKCPECGKQLASTMISDSPVAGAYALKTLLIMSNVTLRQEKGLSPKRTLVTFQDETSGKRILWKDIVAENKKWEKKVGLVQRKPF